MEMAKVKEELLKALLNLGEKHLKSFQWYLTNCVEGSKTIPIAQLENADRYETVDMMVQSYHPNGAVDVMLNILVKMNLYQQAEDLKNNLQYNITDPDQNMSAKTGVSASVNAQHTVITRVIKREVMILSVEENAAAMRGFRADTGDDCSPQDSCSLQDSWSPQDDCTPQDNCQYTAPMAGYMQAQSAPKEMPSLPDCPPGLEFLTQIDQLLVFQEASLQAQSHPARPRQHGTGSSHYQTSLQVQQLLVFMVPKRA
ncbi:uncharacterized protein LOC143474736 isoform X3 [Brachyhypopomus gauderio]|uniref:uncharacterized protein LOC143474736 isoform X3 n=1 Tax=Brachyhypopomus gauderio TaxID=698409 RepID=UPI0040419682